MLTKPYTPCLLAAVATVLASLPAHAISRYWDVNGTASGFSTVAGAWDGTNAFWNTDSTGGAGTLTAAPTSADDLVIKQAIINTGNLTVTGTQNASSITFVANVGPTANITGGSIIIGGTGASSGIFQQSTGANTANSALTLKSTVQAFSFSNTSAGLLTIGTITGAATAGTQTITTGSSAAGGITLNNVIADSAVGGKVALIVNSSGAGHTTLSGTNTYTGNTTVTGGTLDITGSLTGNTATSTLALGTAAANTVTNVSGNLTLFNVTAGAIAGSSAVYNQTAGTVNVTPTGSSAFSTTNGYGHFNLTGGTFKVNAGTNLFASGTNATGVAYVGGTGTLDLTSVSSNGGIVFSGAGCLTVGPGGTVSRGAAGGAYYLTAFSNSYGIINVAGGSFDLGSGLVRVGNGTGQTGMTAFVNLAGGTLNLGSVITPLGAGASFYANYAGGTLKASANLTNPVSTGSGVTTISILYGPIDNAGTSQDFAGGLTLDTNGFAVTYGNALRGATGNGVKQGNITIAGGSGYTGAPLVKFTGGTLVTNGSPASGYALVSGGAVTGIVITSPGSYTVDPTVTLTGGGGSGASVSLSTLSANPADSGLTKIGSGTLTLGGANTYAGNTIVSAGTLSLGAGNVLPSTPVSIGTATLNSATFSDTVGTLDITGNAVINLGAGAALAFADTHGIDWTGGTLTITGTFASGTSLRFGTSSSGLTPSQLALISIPGGAAAALDSNGFLIDTSNSPYISAFQSSAPFVQRPATPTLSWSIGGTITSLTIEPDIGDVLPLTTGGSGSIPITPPLGEQTYQMTLNGTISQTVSIVSLPPKNKLHIYLLIGQSNMQGAGSPYSSTLDAAVPRVVKFGSRTGMESVWVKGGHPLTSLSSTGGSVGMGLEFAKTMLAANSDPEVVIGLINHGLGSTKIEWWAPGAIDDVQINPVTNQNYRLYDEAVQRVMAASPYGVLKGVLWHQGESNSGTQAAADAYAGQLQDLVSNLRISFNNPNLPFVCGKFVPATWLYADGSPGAFTGLPYRATTEATLMDLPNHRPLTYCADNNGLRGRSDELIHFDAYSQRLLGQRYAAGMIGIQTAANHVPIPTPLNVTTTEDTAKAVALAATDADEDPLIYSIVTPPASGTLSGTPPNLTYTPGADFNGSDSFAFSVSDGIATSTPATVSISVTPVNDAPVLTPIPAKNANEGVLLTFTASATDIDLPANTLTYSLINAPVGAAMDPHTGIFIWTPSSTQGPGNYEFIVRVSDGTLAHDQIATVAVAGVSGNPGDDADGDGISNLIEYGLGTPQDAPSAPDRLPKAAVIDGKLTVTYRRPANGGTPGTSYVLQTQDQLAGSWTTAVAGVDYTPTIVDQGDGSERVTATFSTLPAPGEKHFVRLSISIP